MPSPKGLDQMGRLLFCFEKLLFFFIRRNYDYTKRRAIGVRELGYYYIKIVAFGIENLHLRKCRKL